MHLTDFISLSRRSVLCTHGHSGISHAEKHKRAGTRWFSRQLAHCTAGAGMSLGSWASGTQALGDVNTVAIHHKNPVAPPRRHSCRLHNSPLIRVPCFRVHPFPLPFRTSRVHLDRQNWVRSKCCALPRRQARRHWPADKAKRLCARWTLHAQQRLACIPVQMLQNMQQNKQAVGECWDMSARSCCPWMLACVLCTLSTGAVL